MNWFTQIWINSQKSLTLCELIHNWYELIHSVSIQKLLSFTAWIDSHKYELTHKSLWLLCESIHNWSESIHSVSIQKCMSRNIICLWLRLNRFTLSWIVSTFILGNLNRFKYHLMRFNIHCLLPSSKCLLEVWIDSVTYWIDSISCFGLYFCSSSPSLYKLFSS